MCCSIAIVFSFILLLVRYHLTTGNILLLIRYFVKYLTASKMDNYL
nr:MAG TPA: hypothetical protein [Caudoviricetes sp.]